MLSLLLAHPASNVKLDVLLEENYKFVTSRVINETYLEMVKTDVLLTEDRLVVKTNTCDGFNFISKNKGIIVGEISKNILNLLVDCTEDFDTGMIIQKIGITPFAWPFRVGAPFISSFNIHKKRIIQSKYIQFIYQKMLIIKKPLILLNQYKCKNKKKIIILTGRLLVNVTLCSKQ